MQGSALAARTRMQRVALLLLVAACSSSEAPPSEQAVQMNDLSILFPLSGAATDYLAASTPAVGGPLLPEAVLEHDLDAPQLPYESLRAVAFRLDPCFGQIGPVTDAATCKNQLRIVFQVLTTAAGVTTAADSGVHAFYALTRDELLATVGEIIAARREAGGDDDLGPLAPHPLVARDGMTGELARRLEAIVVEHAGADKLVRFTSLLGSTGDAFSLVGGNEFWQLHGFDVAPDGSASQIAIPTLADTTEENISGTPGSAGSAPITTSADDIQVLTNSAVAMEETQAARQAAFDAALRIESPGHHSPDTIDCGGCHLAEPARVLVAPSFGLSASGNPNEFVADPSIPAADLAATTIANLAGSDGVLHVHAFSYRETLPMINQRVINETAANLAYLAPLLR